MRNEMEEAHQQLDLFAEHFPTVLSREYSIDQRIHSLWSVLNHGWKNLALMMEPIEDDCLCDFPCVADDDPPDMEYDCSNPEHHYQYCPVYLHAYVLAKAEGRSAPK